MAPILIFLILCDSKFFFMEHNHALCQFNSVQTIKLMKLTLLIHGETTDNSDMETSHKLMMMMMN